MTKEVNSRFAQALEGTIPRLNQHLVSVFEPVCKEKAERVIDQIADLMARNINDAETKKPVRPAGRRSSR